MSGRTGVRNASADPRPPANDPNNHKGVHTRLDDHDDCFEKQRRRQIRWQRFKQDFWLGCIMALYALFASCCIVIILACVGVM